MNTITFYTHPYSRGRIVRWMLEELGEPYDVQLLEYGSTMKAPEYLAINPMGKVPAIKHGDTVVTEVAAICAYLADQFPEKNLAPASGSKMRGTYYRWMFFVAGPLEMATTSKAFGWKIDDENAVSIGCGHYQDAIDAMVTALEKGPYICGDQFTAADVLIGSYLGWGIMQKNIEPLPAFTAYLARIEGRDAARRANELDDALIKQD
ncbi:MAG: glutathione S-transferase family protein [Pseudohongiella sp.]|uniref:glutathione S-transferase family protein n=1 Tax=Pseudohongiella sp. TaxID=1979412 RepID=UPI0034A040F2